MIRTRTLAAAAVLLAGPSAQAAAPSPEPMTLLSSALEGPSAPYRGRMTITRWFGKQTRSEEVVVYAAPGGLYRYEFLDPAGKPRRLVVSDGTTEELSVPGRPKTLRGSALKSVEKLMTQDKERALLLANYSVAIKGQEKALGRGAWALEITPLTPGKPSQHLLVDQETGVILETRRFHPDGSSAQLSRLTRFEPRVSLEPALFHLEPESDRTDAHGLDPDFLTLQDLSQAGHPVRPFPERLEGGFAFESGDYFEVKGRTVLSLRYTDGLVSLSLFLTDSPVSWGGSAQPEPQAPAAAPASPRRTSSGRIAHWKEGKTFLTLIGDVSAQVLDKAAADLKKTPVPGGHLVESRR